MDRETLRKVQMVQLEIAQEIKRVCEEYKISYFLEAGTLIGAVRHHGFIPWDDDLDIGMLREDYDRFVQIAPMALKPEYLWQDWLNDEHYALPFGKVRKKNTLYQEEKSSKLKNNGFYVDVFPFDSAPEKEKDRIRLRKQCDFLYRCLLMKEGYRPWISENKINWKKRMVYLFYQGTAIFRTHDTLVHKYEEQIRSIPESGCMYEQVGYNNSIYFERKWLETTKEASFEGELFQIPIGTDERLTVEYGDYMTPPPENKRENRHGIVSIRF